MALLLKIVPSTFENQNRDKRELNTIKELGHEIIVLAKGETNGIKVIDGFKVHCKTTRPLGRKKSLTLLNRFVSLFTWAAYARKIKPDCISGHDLIGIFIGWISTIIVPNNRRPLLIYDSHEFEIGRNTGGKRGKCRTWLISKLEKFLIKKCAFTIMVNDSIADEIQKIYSLDKRPVVVRNIPNYVDIDKQKNSERRKEICKKLGISKEIFLVMYHGVITKGRGLENLIEAVSEIKDIALVILGYGEEEYIKELKQLAFSAGVQERTLFIDAVSTEILYQYIGAVNIGMITVPNSSRSYYFGLPNKLFENIQAETPIVGSDFPELKRIIEGYKVGICCNPHKIDEIVDSIYRLKNDNSLYTGFKNNIRAAKEELNWEKERETLIVAYSDVFNLIDKRKS